MGLPLAPTTPSMTVPPQPQPNSEQPDSQNRRSVAIALKDRLGSSLRVELPMLDQRAALVELFRACDGRRWKQRTNWLSQLPLAQWFGVKVDRSGNVVALLLPYNNLSGVVPASLGCLPFLQELDLRYNQLSEISPALGALSRLEKLHLHCNKLRGTVPPELGGCRALRLLDLHSNALGGLVPVEEIGSLPHLQYINLASNCWSGQESVHRVRKSLPHCRAVMM